MTRTTISIPQDLHREIKRMQQSEPKLTQQKGLIRLARKGAFETSIVDVSWLIEQVERLLSMTELPRNKQNRSPETELLITLQLNTLSLLRHFVSHQLGEQARPLMEKAKQDANRRKKTG